MYLPTYVLEVPTRYLVSVRLNDILVLRPAGEKETGGGFGGNQRFFPFSRPTGNIFHRCTVNNRIQFLKNRNTASGGLAR